MAYSLTCDWEACGATIASGPGQIALTSKETILCPPCAAIAARVEAQMRVESVQFALRGAAELTARRDALMREAMPASKGGTGSRNGWPTVG